MTLVISLGCSLRPCVPCSSFVLQGLRLDVVGDPSGSGQGQDGVVDGGHLHGERDGVLVLVVRCAVILTRGEDTEQSRARVQLWSNIETNDKSASSRWDRRFTCAAYFLTLTCSLLNRPIVA